MASIEERNPWLRLPSSKPFVLPEDAPVIERANERLRTGSAKDKGLYQLQCLPVPYAGRLDAPAVVLNLNPGYTEPAAANPTFSDDWWDEQPAMREAFRQNIAQEIGKYPMFFLDPALSGSPGGRYWNAALSDFIAACGRDNVAKNLLVIESLPYHSLGYSAGPTGLKLPSLAFTHYQIRQAMKRNATIVIWRHKSGFESKVPELASYPYVSVANSQLRYLSRGNVLDFPRVVQALKNHDS